MRLSDKRVREILDSGDEERLVQLVFDKAVDPKERPTAVQRALWELEELSYPGLAKLAVRASVELPKAVCQEVRIWFLDKWVESDGFNQRSEVLRLLCKRLNTGKGRRLVQAIRAVQFIGYADEEIVKRLELLSGVEGPGDSNDNVQGWALTALSRIGYLHPERITQRLESRFRERKKLSEADLWTAFYHASAPMLPVLFDQMGWGNPASQAIANLVEREPTLGKEVWQRFVQKDDNERWLSRNRMAEATDLLEVGAFLVNDALIAFRDFEQRNTLPPMNALIDAYREKVIQGARERGVNLNAHELGWLYKVATLADLRNVRVRTHEGYNKDAAWNVLLHLGRPEARAWLVEAVGEEPSYSDITYAQYAGYLRVGGVVPALAKILRNPEVDLGHGLRVMEALGVIGTEDALRALLDNHVWFIRRDGESDPEEADEDGRHIPKDLVDAMVSACMSLSSDDLVWEALWDDDRAPLTREACAHTLSQLSQYANGPVPRVGEIHAILDSGNQRPKGWKQLLVLRGEFEKHPRTLELLRIIAEEEPDDQTVTEALARSGILGDFPERIAKLGLVIRSGVWHVDEDLGRFPTFVLLLLFKSDRAFTTAMIDAIKVSGYSSASNILYNLHRGETIPPELTKELLNRLINGTGGLYSGSGTIHAIGNVAPNLLLDAQLQKKLDEWDSKKVAEYIVQLRDSESDIDDKNALVDVGTRFLGDEDAEIRRESARLLRTVSVESLENAVAKVLAEAIELHDWVYAIQAAGHLDKMPEEWVAWRDTHPEPLVRQSVRQTIRRIGQASLARDYVRRVLSKSDLLEVWAYGHALLQIGDEETVDTLLDGLPEEVPRRAYLIDLAEKVKKEFETRRKKADDDVVLPPLPDQVTEVEVTFEGFSHLPVRAHLRQREKVRGRRHSMMRWSLEFDSLPEPLQEHDLSHMLQVWLKDGRRGQVKLFRKSNEETGDEAWLGIGQGYLN